MTKDKWHPENVTWPDEETGPRFDLPDDVVEVVLATAYESLYQQREKELAAARELADAVSHAPGTTWDADLVAALARFREVDK